MKDALVIIQVSSLIMVTILVIAGGILLLLRAMHVIHSWRESWEPIHKPLPDEDTMLLGSVVFRIERKCDRCGKREYRASYFYKHHGVKHSWHPVPGPEYGKY
jgi:hypothetical protein